MQGVRNLMETVAEYVVDTLSPIRRRFVMHWGEMGTRWGVNRTVAQIHALLFLSGRPMHAEEIAEIGYQYALTQIPLWKIKP